MKCLRLILPIAVLGLSIAAAPLPPQRKSAQLSKVFEPSKDVTLVQSVAGDLGNSRGAIFVGRTGQPEANQAKPQVSIRRGLLAFDVAGEIPRGSKIISVKLSLNMTLTPNETLSARLRLHRVLQDWGEADTKSGGVGATSVQGEATWLHRFDEKRKWSRPGGDYLAVASAVQPVTGVRSYTFGSNPRMVADVQAWLDSPKRNFGWILLGNETEGRSVKVFASREDSDPQKRPQLSVTFRPPTR